VPAAKRDWWWTSLVVETNRVLAPVASDEILERFETRERRRQRNVFLTTTIGVKGKRRDDFYAPVITSHRQYRRRQNCVCVCVFVFKARLLWGMIFEFSLAFAPFFITFTKDKILALWRRYVFYFYSDDVL